MLLLGSTALSLAIVACMPLAVAPEQAIPDTAVADQEHRRQKHQTADRARFTLQEESDQVEHYEHNMRLHQGRVRRFRNQQHRNQTLQAVHVPVSVFMLLSFLLNYNAMFVFEFPPRTIF